MASPNNPREDSFLRGSSTSFTQEEVLMSIVRGRSGFDDTRYSRTEALQAAYDADQQNGTSKDAFVSAPTRASKPGACHVKKKAPDEAAKKKKQGQLPKFIPNGPDAKAAKTKIDESEDAKPTGNAAGHASYFSDCVDPVTLESIVRSSTGYASEFDDSNDSSSSQEPIPPPPAPVLRARSSTVCNDEKANLRVGQAFAGSQGAYFVRGINRSDNESDSSFSDVAANTIGGTLPTQLGLLTNLKRLIVDANELQGGLPSQSGLLTHSLEWILSHTNSMTGSLPTQLCLLDQWWVAIIGACPMRGPIPTCIGWLSNMQYLHWRNTEITGTLPTQLGLLTNVVELVLEKNNLQGTIPTELFQNTQMDHLFLYGGNFRGTIPTQVGLMSHAKYLWFHDSHYVGTIPSELGLLTNMTHFDISSNELTGTIPTELGELVNLVSLGLDKNRLSGTIPANLCSVDTVKFPCSDDLCGCHCVCLGSETATSVEKSLP